MPKDFDGWNRFKKRINNSHIAIYAYPREIWWCALGVNVGAEIDGKHETFERPVIIMKVYNKESMIVLPITTQPKDNPFHCKIITDQKVAWVKLTQTRTISNKRLLRKVDVLSETEFAALQKVWKIWL